MSGFNFNPDAGWSYTHKSHTSYMHESGHMLAVTRLPGFHKAMIRFDLMHCLHLGILPVTIGSILVVLLERDVWGAGDSGGWVYRWTVQLQHAFVDFKEWLRRHHISSSPPEFTVPRLSMVRKTDRPVFKGKAGQNMLTARWLLSCVIPISNSTRSSYDEAMCSSLWGLIRGVDIFQAAGKFLNSSEKAQLEIARQAAFTGHSFLAHRAILASSGLFRTLPKTHYCDHIYRAVDGRNGADGWTFADEDFIGRLIRINRRSSDGAQLIKKYILRLDLLLNTSRISIPQL